MRVTPLLFIAVLALSPGAVLRAEDPTKLDPAERNTQLAPTNENSDNRLSPNRESNQRPFFRNDQVQEQRFNAPEKIERKEAAVGDKRAAIDVTETRKKTIIDRKEFPKPEVRGNKMSTLDGEKSAIQPKGDLVKKYDKVSRFQDGMANASASPFQRQPTLEKRTTFEKLNRFIFKRNGPGSEGGNATVTPAAGGPPPASQDTYTKYQVDWKRADEVK